MWRLQQFLRKLVRGEPTTTLLIGGSNSLEAYTGRRRNFASLIEDWLNSAFPPRGGAQHVVVNRGSGGIGACVASNNIDTYMESVKGRADLLLLEFAITDGLEL